MNIEKVGPGDDIPDEFNTIIEIPLRGEPIKYEIDKATGAMFVDRFMNTAMHYPCNYGYIPHTLAEDGDPVDVLVLAGIPLIPGSVIQCRPVGVLAMTDEAGADGKVLAVPVDRTTTMYRSIQSPRDLPPAKLSEIEHFFAHYKDLEQEKWVRIDGWRETESAREEIMTSVDRYQSAADRPNF